MVKPEYNWVKKLLGQALLSPGNHNKTLIISTVLIRPVPGPVSKTFWWQKKYKNQLKNLINSLAKASARAKV